MVFVRPLCPKPPHADVLASVSRSSALVVFIAECRYLGADGGQSKKFAPYVKCYLLPDRSIKRKSSTKKSTSSPKFNQELKVLLLFLDRNTEKLQT